MNSNKQINLRNDWEDQKQKVACLYIIEDLTYKAAVAPAIAAFKAAMSEISDEPCYWDYCPGCESGCDTCHTYNPQYCCCCDEEPNLYSEYPGGDY